MVRMLLGTVLVSAAIASAVPPAAAQAGDPLTPGEMVFVEVYRRPELSSSAQIDSSGNITLPYVGSVKVSGMTEQEASAGVSTAFLKILKNPRVTITRSAAGIGSGFRTAEMKTELIPLQNADAETLSSAFRGMTSEGGAISFDPDTNTLIVTDTPSAIKNIMSVANRLDQMQSQLTQVRIEAKIAEVKAGAMKELGVRWFVQEEQMNAGYYPLGAQDYRLDSLRGRTSAPNNSESIGAIGSSGVSVGGRRFIDENNFDRRLNVPIHVPKPGQFFFGLLNKNIDLGVMLDALVADDQAELLASPNILTVNHTQAEIRSVEKFPYVEYGTDFGRSSFSTRFLDLGITLKVTPHVYKDERGTYVKLALEPEVSYPTGSADGVPIPSIRSSKTVARVRDNQTLVIGGIYRNDHRDMVTRVPGLGKVPVIGSLFRHSEKVKTQTELMVFVTPTVHETPESVTWDRMLSITSASEVIQQVPARDALRERRRE